VGYALYVAQAHGQQWLGPVQRLNLRLLVDAEHYRLVRWVQVETEDVANLLDKEGDCGELERFLPVSLCHVAVDGTKVQAHASKHKPMRGFSRLRHSWRRGSTPC
jgi:hypothetical protein